MKTVGISLPVELHRDVKSEALKRDRTLQDVTAELFREWLKQPAPKEEEPKRPPADQRAHDSLDVILDHPVYRKLARDYISTIFSTIRADDDRKGH